MKNNFSSFGFADNPADKEQKLFFARLDDLYLRSSVSVTHTAFLTPSEQYRALNYFSAKGRKDKICFFGGYYDAQRKQIFLLPDYLCDYDENEKYRMLADDFDSAQRAIKITGSGFCALTHRDYLGSVLALGIERETIGDICVLDERTAIIFCTAEVGDYILSSLETVGRDRVRTERIKPDINMPSTQKYQAFTDTVASDRLDCTVGALFNLSREKAQNLIKGGYVEHNYETALRTDARVEQDDIISARGFGKFIVRDISQSTKKGRIRLLADKFI